RAGRYPLPSPGGAVGLIGEESALGVDVHGRILPQAAAPSHVGSRATAVHTTSWITLTSTTSATSTSRMDTTTPAVAARPTPSVPPWADMPAWQPTTPTRNPNTTVLSVAGTTSRRVSTRRHSLTYCVAVMLPPMASAR